MRSGKFKSGLVLFSFVAIFATVSAVRADGDPVKGREAIAIRMDELDGQIKKLDAEIKAEEAKNEPDETKLQSLTDQRSKLQGEFNTYRHKSKAADRKYDKVVRDETEAAEIDQELATKLDELKKGVEGGTFSEKKIKKYQRDIQKLQKRKEFLVGEDGRVSRKEKQYEKKVHEDMPDRCRPPLFWNNEDRLCLPHCDPKTKVVNKETKECDAKCDGDLIQTADRKSCMCKVAGEVETNGKCSKVLPDSEKQKLDDCYLPVEEKPTATMYVHFGLGDDGIPDVWKGSNNVALKKTFIEYGDAVRKALTEGGYAKIGKLEATGYASRVRGKTRTSEKLAEARAKRANTELTGFLALPSDESQPVGSLSNLNLTATPASPAEIGPAWEPADYQTLNRRVLTDRNRDRLLTNYAQAMQKRYDDAIKAHKTPDPTPVLVPGDLEATKAKLAACCGATEATLKYQPYQFTEVKVYGVKFKPDLEACVKKSEEVANQTASKSLPTTDAATAPAKASSTRISVDGG